MKHFRLACALAVAIIGAATVTYAEGKPPFAPPSDPPDTLLEYACSLLPSAVASHVPFCAD